MFCVFRGSRALAAKWLHFSRRSSPYFAIDATVLDAACVVGLRYNRVALFLLVHEHLVLVRVRGDTTPLILMNYFIDEQLFVAGSLRCVRYESHGLCAVIFVLLFTMKMITMACALD